MEISLKAPPPSNIYSLEVAQFDDYTGYKVYLDGRKAPKRITQAILFLLQEKGEPFVLELAREIRKITK